MDIFDKENYDYEHDYNDISRYGEFNDDDDTCYLKNYKLSSGGKLFSNLFIIILPNYLGSGSCLLFQIPISWNIKNEYYDGFDTPSLSNRISYPKEMNSDTPLYFCKEIFIFKWSYS